MASLIPSEPNASVPYGNLFEPDTLLSSDTFSDSSLNTVHILIPHQLDQVKKGYEPEQSKDTRHASDSKDLALDDLPALCSVFWGCRW